ncbi:MAG: hypothetical protein HQ578_06835 [Chloroflexi bacterium]|nr:hypothetical protein [Chloroflexota bacterium]
MCNHYWMVAGCRNSNGHLAAQCKHCSKVKEYPDDFPHISNMEREFLGQKVTWAEHHMKGSISLARRYAHIGGE